MRPWSSRLGSTSVASPPASTSATADSPSSEPTIRSCCDRPGSSGRSSHEVSIRLRTQTSTSPTGRSPSRCAPAPLSSGRIVWQSPTDGDRPRRSGPIGPDNSTFPTCRPTSSVGRHSPSRRSVMGRPAPSWPPRPPASPNPSVACATGIIAIAGSAMPHCPPAHWSNSAPPTRRWRCSTGSCGCSSRRGLGRSNFHRSTPWMAVHFRPRRPSRNLPATPTRVRSASGMRLTVRFSSTSSGRLSISSIGSPTSMPLFPNVTCG